MTEPNELADAVDALTLPVTLHQTISDSRFTCVVFDTPLLDRLQHEIRFSLSREGSKSLPNQRIPINSGALMLFMRISSQITDWANGARSTTHKHDPSRTLRAWFTTWTQTARESGEYAARVKILTGWEAAILRELEPPRQKDLPQPCPKCHASEWWRDGERYPRPLVVESPRNPEKNLVDESTAHCRACGATWGARELGLELEQHDTNPENGSKTNA